MVRHSSSSAERARAEWMRWFEKELLSRCPHLAGRIDWDTAGFLFKQHATPYDAAIKVAEAERIKLHEAAIALLRRALVDWPQFDLDNVPVSGADLVDWFVRWRPDVKALIASIDRKVQP